MKPRFEPVCPLRAAALATPDAAAILDARRAVSYAGLDRWVSDTVARLREAGYGPGARVALYMPRDERYVVFLLALLRAGCISCPLSTRLPPQGVPRLLRRAACATLVSEDERILGVLPSGARGLPPEALIGGPGEEGVGRDRAESVYLPLERPATVVFTSGSTGGPKAALHTFGNHYYSALGSNANIALSPGDRWLLSLPLYHVGGLSIIFRCLLAGATIVLPETGAPVGRSMAEFGITHASLVATQLRRLLQERVELTSLKAVLLGGGPTPESLLADAADRGLPVHNSYGLTEMASQVTTTPPAAIPEDLRTSGRPLAHREVAVSEEGEILVRGDTLFAGYVEGDGIDRPLDAEGWFHTRDLGEIDERGNLHVKGRLDNLFISGGENVRPEEIEEALERMEEVERAVVVPVPDSEFGERPVAFLQVAGAGKIPESLAGKLEKALPRFKIPVAFYEWPDEADVGGRKPDRGFLRGRAQALRREA